jgi:hypothetical protein
MRSSVWVLVSVLALGAAACSQKPSASAPATETAAVTPAATAAPAPPPTDDPSAITPATAEAADATAAQPAAAPAPASAQAPPAAPAAEAPYRFTPSDFPKQERRIAALVANAETRDTSGETAGFAYEGQQARARCTTRKCVEAIYANEEAQLRRWEGSADIK